MLRYIWTAHESQDLNRFLVDGTSRGRCTNQIVEDFPASFLNGNANDVFNYVGNLVF